MIAKMVAGFEASRLLTMKAAELKNRGVRNTRETSLMKWHACDVALQVGRRCDPDPRRVWLLERVSGRALLAELRVAR